MVNRGGNAVSTVGRTVLLAIYLPTTYQFDSGVHTNTMPHSIVQADNAFLFDPKVKDPLSTDGHHNMVNVSHRLGGVGRRLARWVKPEWHRPLGFTCVNQFLIAHLY